MAKELRPAVLSFLISQCFYCCCFAEIETCTSINDEMKCDCASCCPSNATDLSIASNWIYMFELAGSMLIICLLAGCLFKVSLRLSLKYADYARVLNDEKESVSIQSVQDELDDSVAIDETKSTRAPSIEYASAPRAVLGCLQVATDYVLDSEAPALISRFPGVEYRSQKIRLEGDCITLDNFEQSAQNITDAVSCLHPPDRCTVIGISCTSMSFTLGPEAVDKLIKDAVPGVAVTDMARGQAEAIRALEGRKIALFTPYIESVSLANAAMLEKYGFEVVSRLTMGLERDEHTSLVSLECIREWAKAVDVKSADVVVIGCSALRACPPNGFLDDLESELGKPVVTSTQAFLWIMLRTAGIREQITGYGTLFREH